VAPSGEVPLSVSKDKVTINGTLKGSGQTRGEAQFSGDGKHAVFNVKFTRPYTVRPVVVISANQFERCRIVSIDTNGFSVEFEKAPKVGKGNITIWWMAQE
jgi:hypothetical protein